MFDAVVAVDQRWDSAVPILGERSDAALAGVTDDAALDLQLEDLGTAIDSSIESVRLAEFGGNGADDDGDGFVDERPNCRCRVGSSSVEFDAVRSSLGICDHVDGRLTAAIGGQVAILQAFSAGILPRSNGCLLAISSGLADPINHHGDFYRSGGSGQVNGLFDPVLAVLNLSVPVNARGFAIDFVFMTSEWPEFLCSNYDDRFEILVSRSGAEFVNIAVDRLGAPISVNSVFLEHPSNSTVGITDTGYGANLDIGMECGEQSPLGIVDQACIDARPYCAEPDTLAYVGASTSWLTAASPVAGAETIEVWIRIYDVGDSSYDSLAVVSNFRWLPDQPSAGVKAPP